MSALRNNNNGFTLLEFLVSVVILTVGLLGLLQAVNMAISSNMATTLRNEATVVADEALSKRIALLSTTDTAAFSSFSTTTTANRKIYNGSKNYSVKEIGTPINNSMEVTVTVNWSHKNGNYTHNASSVITKR